MTGSTRDTPDPAPSNRRRTVTSTAPALAGDVMSAPVITVTPQTATADIADTLRQRRISGVVVTDESDTILGLVSEYDLLAKTGASAADVMTTALVSVSADTPIADIRHLLVDLRIGRVPVLTSGKLVGIVSRGDVIALMATEWICDVCGEAVRSQSAPLECPRCQSGPEKFSLHEQLPGT